MVHVRVFSSSNIYTRANTNSLVSVSVCLNEAQDEIRTTAKELPAKIHKYAGNAKINNFSTMIFLAVYHKVKDKERIHP